MTVALAACVADVEGAGPIPTPAATGIVVRVADGDSGTVEVEGRSVEFRLDRVNAPERGECLHDAARDFLADLVGREVEVEDRGLDQFGRMLVDLRADDRKVNLDLVASGLGIAATGDDRDEAAAAILAAEEEAFRSGLGLWSPVACGGSAPPPVDVLVERSVFDPPGPDEEAISEELVAFGGDSTVDLVGWTVRDESSVHRCLLGSGVGITPGQVLEVTSAEPCWDPGGIPVWNNGGDVVLLLDPNGNVAARHRYP